MVLQQWAQAVICALASWPGLETSMLLQQTSCVLQMALSLSASLTQVSLVKMLHCTLQVPFAFKYAIDALTVDPTGLTAATTPLITLMPATLLLGYGAARAGSALFNELRNAVFAKVTLHAKFCANRCIHALQ